MAEQTKMLDTPGARLRWLRTEHLSLTQEEFALRVGCERTHLNKVEKGVRRISPEILEAVWREFKVSSDWIMRGGTFATGATYKGVRSDTTAATIVRESPATYLSTADERVALKLVERHRPLHTKGDPGRFGYARLKANNSIRFAAARDPLIMAAENLIFLIENDDTWKALGDVKGWMFEVLREYIEYVGDRPVEGWLEVLQFLKWSGSDAEAVSQTEEQSAAQAQQG